MSIRRSIQACLLGATVLFYAPSAEADAVAAATEVIGGLQSTFVEVLQKAEELGFQGRLARLKPAIEKAFDCRFMARAAIGRQWKKLSDNDQDRWADTFREFTIANYARRLDHYSGQTFETLGSEPGSNDTVTVLTRVIDPADKNVDLTYRLRETDGGWRIIDIFANGTISELAIRRSEYTTVLKKDGVEKLIALVNGKIADLAAGKQVD